MQIEKGQKQPLFSLKKNVILQSDLQNYACLIFLILCQSLLQDIKLQQKPTTTLNEPWHIWCYFGNLKIETQSIVTCYSISYFLISGVKYSSLVNKKNL